MSLKLYNGEIVQLLEELELYKAECIKNDLHISSVYCWCEPELAYIDPDTETEIWLHKERH